MLDNIIFSEVREDHWVKRLSPKDFICAKECRIKPPYIRLVRHGHAFDASGASVKTKIIHQEPLKLQTYLRQASETM